MNILEENKNYIVCVKDVGIGCEEAKGDEQTMVSLIREHKKVNNEDGYVGTVHRLDITTGGVMVFAKKSFVAACFCKLIEQKEGFLKEYIAVIHEKPENKSGIFKDFLFKDNKKNKSFAVKKMRKGVKEATLEYDLIKTVTENQKVYSLVKIKLYTGRTHQIRVQFSSRKMPLVGDGKYGSKENRCLPALWALKVSFDDPFSNEKQTFSSLPDLTCFPWNLFDKEDYLELNTNEE